MKKKIGMLDTDPLFHKTNPGIRIQIKMKWIHNTDFAEYILLAFRVTLSKTKGVDTHTRTHTHTHTYTPKPTYNISCTKIFQRLNLGLILGKSKNCVGNSLRGDGGSFSEYIPWYTCIVLLQPDEDPTVLHRL